MSLCAYTHSPVLHTAGILLFWNFNVAVTDTYFQFYCSFVPIQGNPVEVEVKDAVVVPVKFTD